MYALALEIDLRFPQCHSLKEKRMTLRPILDGLRQRFEVSVAEVAHQDAWQRCGLGVALVGGDVVLLERVADQVEDFVWSTVDTEVVGITHHWLDIDR